MKVKTTRFGILEINAERTITFPAGLPGFEKLHRFFMLPAEGTEYIQWLQSVEKPEIALLVIDPFQYFADYSVEIPEPDLKELGLANPADALVLTTITVPRNNPGNATANLLAPVVMNTKYNKAKQVILTGSPYTTKHNLFPQSKETKQQPERACNGEGV
ncbi:MAG: flagellar assembly protein FliW [Firmicutes bacterium]|nr:flagellar assembly protein FliW [Bacillota bacterium]